MCVYLQGDIEKGLEMKRLVLSGFLASEEIYINQLEALLLVTDTGHTPHPTHTVGTAEFFPHADINAKLS